MLIQYKLQPPPNDGSQLNWRSVTARLEEILQKKIMRAGGKPVLPVFGTLTHVILSLLSSLDRASMDPEPSLLVLTNFYMQHNVTY